ncbi:hypothetical protein [Marinomonas ostreistagni]|uniref:Uncharacterized protein n=1 Tax=Marinomonas ostreistagni TaxID=359209 RepID=A0ABS0ZBQ4_9GAMM|nr:hypothetical protein [Marinomonas ostreistagni]MBJ7551102.1 hypothetical protein [Marinomonas ostreistagni]
MFNRDKPLFSRPVLAVIIVVTTLAVWLLNLTDPRTVLEQPSVESWKTDSGIPVYWVTQNSWSGSDKVEMAIVFHAETSTPSLTQATWERLTGATLPLSTATINQRLTPLAAKADSHYDPQQQTLQVSFSNQEQYLGATMRVLDAWLNRTQFKYSSLQNNIRLTNQNMANQQLLLQLWPEYNASQTNNLEGLSPDLLSQHLQTIKQAVSHITLAGTLNDTSKAQLKSALNRLTAHMALKAPPSNWESSVQSSVSILGQQELQAFYGAMTITPLLSVTDWLALQILAKDSLDRQKQALNSTVGQWQLHLSPWQPYVTWQLQAPQSVLASASQSSDPESSWVVPSSLPSYQNADAFIELKQQLLAQLSQLSQNPTWWAAIGSRVAYPNSALDLESFAEHYSDAANSFTMSQYQAAIDRLLIISSRQEVLVKL